MNIVEKRLDEIRPYANNPRKNDEAVEAVANSIREFGFKQPIVVDYLSRSILAILQATLTQPTLATCVCFTAFFPGLAFVERYCIRLHNSFVLRYIQ